MAGFNCVCCDAYILNSPARPSLACLQCADIGFLDGADATV